ncbi:hypothetical protein [Desulfonauticus submarinus]|uniref:hypothetical protein n=1 Tax=Desulfonauticus submarinus TaxID=206665 RepID=UPI0013565ED3|nr:hypothetical protein [Desulfonauticus submarinus]
MSFVFFILILLSLFLDKGNADDFTLYSGNASTQTNAKDKTGAPDILNEDNFTIESGASISVEGSGAKGINAGNNTTITNSGSISTSVNAWAAIETYGIYAIGNNTIIKNLGTIKADSWIGMTSDSSKTSGIYSFGTNISITNSGTIIISSKDWANPGSYTTAYGVYVIGNNNFIDNSGLINVSVLQIYRRVEGSGLYVEGDDNTINNLGTIIVNISEDSFSPSPIGSSMGYGINIYGDSNMISNLGNVTVSTTADSTYAEIYGINIEGNGNTITKRLKSPH